MLSSEIYFRALFPGLLMASQLWCSVQCQPRDAGTVGGKYGKPLFLVFGLVLVVLLLKEVFFMFRLM